MIIGHFATRRDAERAVEHLVQEHGLERTDIFVVAEGAANSAGTRVAGADLESGHYGAEDLTNDKEPELAGAIEVSVECDDEQTEIVTDALRAAGAEQVRLQ
ncbi:hypothetical protein SAMN06265338_103147 [Rhodoblastus acidophilus]|uniref:Uncharacterized protein n=1 Tax=Rhodoblastus acidophilus TaxID=1074 RepID=A0A212R9W1_RHOAC|nr:hypothetical protein [Rhodoblastus acidophilus]MCW2317404.1 hypothetical protein [Rhodoblastus acidophilus]PPQ39306.1 hypothetical protein CKO16_06005 [Rhodoblastus acidophilus]RAI22379.1 hypothetical protein CH337_05200 [Rhodoblastus acidophilus]SNB68987.1 hypothetical protein SAMN06265338_103147 [Rhodoblastus acidophilus]